MGGHTLPFTSTAQGTMGAVLKGGACEKCVLFSPIPWLMGLQLETEVPEPVDLARRIPYAPNQVLQDLHGRYHRDKKNLFVF